MQIRFQYSVHQISMMNEAAKIFIRLFSKVVFLCICICGNTGCAFSHNLLTWIYYLYKTLILLTHFYYRVHLRDFYTVLKMINKNKSLELSHILFIFLIKLSRQTIENTWPAIACQEQTEILIALIFWGPFNSI